MPGYGRMHIYSMIPKDLTKLTPSVLQGRCAHLKIMFNTTLIENQVP